MDQMIRATATMGKVITQRDYANFVVLRTESRPSRVLSPPFTWLAQTFDGGFEVGFALLSPVRLTPWPDGGPPRPEPILYLDDVTTGLEDLYEGKRVSRFMNPAHEDNTVEIVSESQPASLHQLTTRELARRKGGRSRSPAKIQAARENMAMINEQRIAASDARIERFLEMRDAGMSIPKIAAEEGCSVPAVKCALQRARKAEKAATAQRDATMTALRQEHARLTDNQRQYLHNYEGCEWEHVGDGSIRIQFDGGYAEVN